MADLAASILAPTLDSAIKNVCAVIKRQFIYICCFNGNITGLQAELVKLDNAIEGLRARVDAATNNVEDIAPEVSFWLSGSDNIKEETTRILNEARNVESGYLRLGARFTLSRRAVKTAIAMVQQRQDCIFNNISLPPRIAASRAIPLGKTSAYEFESRKKIEKDIMKVLGDKKENMIGICGMGGLGKTTMAKRIMNRALEENVFEEVVMVVVSQQVDESKIQLEIGGSLGLDLKYETSQARIQKLHEKLTGKKKILLVLDDIWTNLNLNDLGIPCDDGSNGCIILITSRNRCILTAMGVREVFGMDHLSKEDAWFLFKKKAGTCVDESKLSSTAKKVAKQCNGLPVALAAVGASLKDEKDVRVWKNALKQLRKPNPNSTPDFIAQVYNPVIVSYDKLSSEEVRSLLLLCCLFPEDSDISVDLLSCFCFGLRLFTDIGSLEEARNRTWTSIKSLKDRSLLLDSEEEDCIMKMKHWSSLLLDCEEEDCVMRMNRSLLLDCEVGDCVRMHDSVRDVCVFISTKKGYIGGNDCRWVFSSEEKLKHPAPNLQLLSLEDVEIDDAFFERIRELKVLSIESFPSISLPQTTQLLKDLRTLRLYRCHEMKTISIVGDLVNLEIFICNGCYRVKELPAEIKRLNRLKLLDISYCRRLKSIGRDIISSLVRLEELKMVRSFDKWEGDDGARENAGVRELEMLTKLKCLEIEIADPALAGQNMQISSKLERFKVIIPSRDVSFDSGSNKSLVLDWKEDSSLGHWIKMQLLRDTECLHLTGKGANKLDPKKLQNIRRLMLGKCESVNGIVFPLIEYLHIFSLEKQEEIWDAPISLFTNLSSIEIKHCPRLLNVGQLLIAGLSDCLPQLETLEISDCETMEQVFLCRQHKNISATPDCHNSKLLFPKLKELDLSYLPNLTTFCQGSEGIAFPLLEKIRTFECPKLRSIISTTLLNGNERGANNGDNDDHHCTASNQVSFGRFKVLCTDQNPFWGYKIHVSSLNKLKDITICGYHGSKNLYTSSMTEDLVSLKRLTISDCDEMSQVIKDDREKEGVSGGVKRNRLFPNLEILKLDNLRNLETFCKWECDIELPSLMTVTIEACPNMKNFTLGSLTAPKWQALSTSVSKMFDVVVNGSFSNMKNLKLKGIENPLCHYKVNVSLFNWLERIEIGGYDGNMSLFTSSIAGNFFNLKGLKVSYCKNMSKVIEDGEEEKDKVVNLLLPVFPKLEELTLICLPELVSFWEWKGDVVWPSLREVVIKSCPYMMNITLGLLTTPNLTSVSIEYEDYHIDAANDLNGMLQKSAIYSIVGNTITGGGAQQNDPSN